MMKNYRDENGHLWCSIPETEKAWDAIFDQAYDAGFDDAQAGRPKAYGGDLQEIYDTGYEDGLFDQAYDAGFDDAQTCRRPKAYGDGGDLQELYDTGYEDGLCDL